MNNGNDDDMPELIDDVDDVDDDELIDDVDDDDDDDDDDIKFKLKSALIALKQYNFFMHNTFN